MSKRPRSPGSDATTTSSSPPSSSSDLPPPAKKMNVADPKTWKKHPEPTSKYHYAMICSSNMNRSCAGHLILLENGIQVSSYGAGAQVKLPGKHSPKIFPFGTTYDEMYKTLEAEDQEFYTTNEMLSLLDRNRNMKKSPERWQEADVVGKVNVAVCFDDRIFELVDEDCSNRDGVDYENLHVINIDTKDNPEAAAISAELALELCQRLDKMEELDEDEVPDLISAFEQEKNITLKHSMHCL
jgi:RNA polymerase II subunit A C-terminal domain phosphatase SSU72